MAIATGVAKQVAYKAESAWGTVPAASSAQALRRVSSSLNLSKATYQSAEIRSDYQIADFRHGVRSVAGSISGELSPGTYEDFFAAGLRKVFAAVPDLTSLSLTIAASGSLWTVTRGSGSFFTDGVKVGQVIRITAGSVNATNSNKNLLVVALTATIATVSVLNGSALTAEGPVASCTIAVPGKEAYAPTTGHTDASFSIEHWFSDISQSEVYSGCKVNSIGLALPPTGIATAEFGFMGKDITTAASQYFTSPTAITTSGVLASVNGVLAVSGTPIALLTGLQINLAGNMSASPVVGSNVYPDIFEGRVIVTGQFTAFFESATLRDLFINETEASLVAAFTTANTAAADFMAFSLPRIKVGGASKDDGEKGLIQTFPFQALYNSSGGATTSTHATTLAVQDSLA